MAYNLSLAERIRDELKSIPGLQEKKMFGGIGFIIHGNMACGVHGEDLIVRTGPDNYQAALTQPHTRPFDMTGKPMAGWILVDPKGYAVESDLRRWVRQGVKFAQSLPPK
jgi:TfoX/Sxy family transcriptional regulator of competence genes